MTSNQPRFQLSGLHTTQPVSLLVYAWNKKGRSEVVQVREDVVITLDTGSQSTGENGNYINLKNLKSYEYMM